MSQPQLKVVDDNDKPNKNDKPVVQRLSLTDPHKVRLFIQKVMRGLVNGEMDNTTARSLNDLARTVLDVLKSEQEVAKIIEIEEKIQEIKNKSNLSI